ncbi:MAG: S-layer homology domain-containing protein, partial [Candidatus Margulisiibacteriota bacterium]
MTLKKICFILLMLASVFLVQGKQALFQSLKPEDRLLTLNKNIMVRGNIQSTVKSVEIDGQNVDINTSGYFSVPYYMPLPGKYHISLTATSITGEKETVVLAVMRLASFGDVGQGSFAYQAIQNLTTLGCLPDAVKEDLQPAAKVTRAELAELLLKLKKAAEGEVLPATGEASAYLEEAVNLGLLSLAPGKTDRSDSARLISREEVIGALVKLEKGSATLPLVINPPFLDVKPSGWAAPYIAQAKLDGWLDYRQKLEFDPKESITRAELYYLLNKTTLAKEQTLKALDWQDDFLLKDIGKANQQKLISMDVQRVDIESVLRGVAAETGYNIVASREVTGKVTAKFTNI